MSLNAVNAASNVPRPGAVVAQENEDRFSVRVSSAYHPTPL